MRFGMKKQQKKIGPNRTIFRSAFLQIEKTYLHYMSIFQSCPILVFYSLNERIRGVHEENIYHVRVFFANFGQKQQNRSKSVQYSQICVFLMLHACRPFTWKAKEYIL